MEHLGLKHFPDDFFKAIPWGWFPCLSCWKGHQAGALRVDILWLFHLLPLMWLFLTSTKSGTADFALKKRSSCHTLMRSHPWPRTLVQLFALLKGIYTVVVNGEQMISSRSVSGDSGNETISSSLILMLHLLQRSRQVELWNVVWVMLFFSQSPPPPQSCFLLLVILDALPTGTVIFQTGCRRQPVHPGCTLHTLVYRFLPLTLTSVSIF